MSFLPGMFAAAAAAGAPAVPAVLTYTDTVGSTSDLSTYTFTNRNIGTAATGRRIIVAVGGGLDGSATATINSVTIGGVTATQIVANTHTGSSRRSTCGIFYADIDAGTTATIAIAWSTTMAQCGIMVAALYDGSSIPFSTSATGTTTAFTLNGDQASGTAAGDVYLAFRFTNGDSARTYTHSITAGASADLTEQFDTTIESTRTYTGSTGTIDSFTTGQFQLTITASGSLLTSVAVAAWFR